MRKVFCFGNEYISSDNLALILADELEYDNFEFIKCFSPDFLMDHQGELLILDVARGINKVEVLNDTDYLKENKLVSLHDFDLNFFLKLLSEMGKLTEIKIIAIPIIYDKDKAKTEIIKILESL